LEHPLSVPIYSIHGRSKNKKQEKSVKCSVKQMCKLIFLFM